MFFICEKKTKCNKKKTSFRDAAVRPATSISHRNEAEVRLREIEAEYYSNQSQHRALRDEIKEASASQEPNRCHLGAGKPERWMTSDTEQMQSRSAAGLRSENAHLIS